MALFEWTDDFITGIEAIDDDHKLLVSLINQLHEATAAGQNREIITSVLTVLMEYTCTHFAREEKILEKSDYPHLEMHQEKHKVLREQVIEIHRRFVEEEVDSIAGETLVFLKEWLTKHILGTDLAYKPYVQGIVLTQQEEMEILGFDEIGEDSYDPLIKIA